MIMRVVRFFGQLYNLLMNKQRLIKLSEILKKYSDMDHKLSINQINALLEEAGIVAVNRKTLYDDLKSLEGFGYEVEFDNGYYLAEAPFSLSEVKILIDSINSLKNLDDPFLDKIKDKLYSFISIYEIEQLKKLEYRNKHKDKHFINRLEDVLDALCNENYLTIRRSGKNQNEVIAPLFLYRQNDYYYLYYHYENNDKLYHVRFDNIKQTSLTDRKNDIQIPIDKIRANIAESSSGFHSTQIRTIRFTICKDSEYLRQRLQDDFENLSFTKDGFFIKTSISNAFFARLVAYGDEIKISDPQVADMYIDYLNTIIIRNKTD